MPFNTRCVAFLRCSQDVVVSRIKRAKPEMTDPTFRAYSIFNHEHTQYWGQPYFWPSPSCTDGVTLLVTSAWGIS